MKKLPIDLEILAVEFEDGSKLSDVRRYLDTETGEIITMDEDLAFQFENDDEPDPDDQMAWEREELLQLQTMREDPDRYAEIPALDFEDRLESITGFIDTVKDSKTKTALKRAIKSSNPEKRMQEILIKVPSEKKRWEAFYDNWLRRKTQDWLRSLEIEIKR